MSPSNRDNWVCWVLSSIGALACLLVVLIVGFLCWEAIPSVRQIGSRFWTDDGWFPRETAVQGSFGIGPMVLGSLLVTCGAVLIAVPFGIVSALFCQFYAPRSIAVTFRRLVELLAGIPSVVFGFWGLVVLAPLIGRWQPPGASLLAGIIVVALMIMPTVMLMAQESLAAVPRSYVSAAAALGIGRLRFIQTIALRQASGGIFSGVILATARAVGETMAVVMVCGNIVRVPSSLFDPVRTLTANIALEMGYALGDHRSALFVCGLVLLLGVAGLLAAGYVGRWLIGRLFHVGEDPIS